MELFDNFDIDEGRGKIEAMNIKYMKFGDGPRTMVILPGLSLRPVSATPQGVISAYEIFTKDFTVYLFDYRENPDEGQTIEDMANDVADALRELDLDKVYLYGVSMGGMVGQVLTIKHPELVKKLVLCSTVSRITENERMKEWLLLAKRKEIIRLVDSFVRSVYSPGFYERSIDIAFSMYKDLTDEDMRDLIVRVEAAEHFDVTNRLKEIRIPVFYLGCLNDQIFTTEQMMETVNGIGCESYFYDNCSHAIYDEEADIKDRIYDFFMKED